VQALLAAIPETTGIVGRALKTTQAETSVSPATYALDSMWKAASIAER